MGACNFDYKTIGKFTPREAYNDLVEDAEYEDGHDAYNGTISTTDGFSTPRGDVPRFGTKAFQKWEEKQLDKMDKRDCLCVELKGAVLKRYKDRTRFKGKKGVRAYYFFGWASC